MTPPAQDEVEAVAMALGIQSNTDPKNLARQAISALDAHRASRGMVLVPAEPTMEMKRAASGMFYDSTFIGTTGVERANLVYHAMLTTFKDPTP